MCLRPRPGSGFLTPVCALVLISLTRWAHRPARVSHRCSRPACSAVPTHSQPGCLRPVAVGSCRIRCRYQLVGYLPVAMIAIALEHPPQGCRDWLAGPASKDFLDRSLLYGGSASPGAAVTEVPDVAAVPEGGRNHVRVLEQLHRFDRNVVENPDAVWGGVAKLGARVRRHQRTSRGIKIDPFARVVLGPEMLGH